jgi:hypothetical protein
VSLASDNPKVLACAIIERVPLAGHAVLQHAATLPRCAQGVFLQQAAQHFLALWPDRDTYKMLPVDIQTFVESPGFLNSLCPPGRADCRRTRQS